MCVVTFDWERNNAVRKFKAFNRSGSVSWAILELTEYCNLNCKWCFANASRIKKPMHMPLDDVKRIVDTLAYEGVKQITYSGGEPTLYPYLKEAIAFAKDREMVVHMNTNGYILTRRLAQELKNSGLSQVQINIDSTYPEKHDEIRGRKGSFKRAIKALENARDAGITCVSQTVLTNRNEGEVVDIFRLARSIGVQRCRIWDMTPSEGCAKDNSHLIPKDYISALQRLSDFAYHTGASMVEVGDPVFIPHIRTELEVSGGYCVFAAGLAMYISRRGDVYFCCSSKNKMYNIFDAMKSGDRLSNIHINATRRYLSAFSQSSTCNKCRYSSLCRGGCYTRREFSGNDTDYWCRINN